MCFRRRKTCGLHTRSLSILCLTKRRVLPGKQYKRHASKTTLLLTLFLSHCVLIAIFSFVDPSWWRNSGTTSFQASKTFGVWWYWQVPSPLYSFKLEIKTVLILKWFYYFYWLQSVHLVELKGTGELYAMKAMEKTMMLNRNKVYDGEWIPQKWNLYYISLIDKVQF